MSPKPGHFDVVLALRHVPVRCAASIGLPAARSIRGRGRRRAQVHWECGFANPAQQAADLDARAASAAFAAVREEMLPLIDDFERRL